MDDTWVDSLVSGATTAITDNLDKLVVVAVVLVGINVAIRLARKFGISFR